MQGKIMGATSGGRSLLAVSVALVLGVVVSSVLADEARLSTVEVRAGQDETKVQPKLRDDIIKTDVIDAQDIRRTNAATLNEAVANNPGVDVQVECSICNVRNVTLNNLPGRFTTIMVDGVPIFSSVSGAYGLDMIGVNGVESIDISRGAGTSLIAPEALSGVVNIVSRRPQAAERVLEGQGGEYGYRRLDGFLAQPFAGGAVTLSVSANHHDSVDHNHNGISEYSGYQRALGGLGLFLDDVGGFRVRGRLDMVSEKRGGGAMGDDYGAIKADMSGNPFDWSRGKHGSPDPSGWVNPGDGSIVAYDKGRGGMSEIIFTDRVQGIVSGERPLDGGARFKFAFGYANHKQDSFYEGDIYKADQDQIYAEISLQRPFGDTVLTWGINYRFEDLRSNGVLSDGTVVSGLDNYEYRTPGVFVQAYRALFDERLEFNGSLRYDDHNVFGGITSPRLNALWHHSHELSSRFAVGKGFRAPTSFYEQDHGILSTTRIDRDIHDPEISHNASYALAYAGDRSAFVLSASYNRIENFALLDSGAIDPVTSEPITLFTQAGSPVTVRGVDATYTYKVTPQLDATIGGDKFSYAFESGVLSFARPEERVYLRLDYDAGNWELFTRATWTGSMDLQRFYDYANEPRYNLDGTRKLDRSPSYWVLDLSGRYRFSKRTALVFGVNNLFDYRQTDTEDFLWVNGDGEFDVTHFWGPNRGRQLYAGMRVDL